MMYSTVQIRFPAEEIDAGKNIHFLDDVYTLGHQVPQTLQNRNVNISMMGNGYCAQYTLLKDNQKAGEGWFYFYGAFEGVKWAVLDEVQLYEEAVA